MLSQTVPPAELGRYAVAVSLSLFPIPLVSAIGNVAFPRLAAQSKMTQASRRLQKASVTGSFVISAGLIIPFAAVAYWIVPLVYGPAYREAVPLLWILAPGSVFFACGQVVGDLLRGKDSLVRWRGRRAWRRSSPWFFCWPCCRLWVSTARPSPQLLPMASLLPPCCAACVIPPRHARRRTAEAIPATG